MNIVWASEYDDRNLNRTFWMWASRKLFGGFKGFGPCCTMGIMDNDELIGVMVYHNYNSDSGVMEISGASSTERWLSPTVLREMFSRPFKQMGCQMVVMRVSPNNKKGKRGLSRMLTAYGFKSYTIPRLKGRFEDEIIFTLTDDAWRTNKFNKRSSEHNGQILSRSARS